MNPSKPGGMLRYGSEAWFNYYEKKYANNPEKLAQLAKFKAKLLGNNNDKFMGHDKIKQHIQGGRPSVKEADVATPGERPGAPNPFDGGTNTPPAGTPGKPRPGDAGLDLAGKIEDIKANSQVWTQSITNRIEDLVKAVASGDKRAARDLISDLKIDAKEFIRYIADDAGVKPFTPSRPTTPSGGSARPSNKSDFNSIVQGSVYKEAFAVRSGKKNIREAKPAAVKLAQRYNLTELKKLYNRAVNKRR